MWTASARWTWRSRSTAFAAVEEKQQLQWDGSEGVHRVDLITQLRTEAVLPRAELSSTSQQPLRPSSSHLSALSAADVLPGNRQVYQLLLTYQWECKEDSVKAVCRLPLLQSVLYESVYESQLVHVVRRQQAAGGRRATRGRRRSA